MKKLDDEIMNEKERDLAPRLEGFQKTLDKRTPRPRRIAIYEEVGDFVPTIEGDPVNLVQGEPPAVEVNVKNQSPKEFEAEVKAKLEAIEEKYKGELTPEQKKERRLQQIALSNQIMGRVEEDWNKLSRKQKRQITAEGQKYSDRVRKRLKGK